MTEWISNKIIELRFLCISFSLLIVLGCVSGIQHVFFSPDMENFFPENHDVVDTHNQMEETFTTTDNLVIAIGVDEGTIFKKETLDVIETLTERSWTIPHSVRVDSITNFSYVSSVDDDLIVIPFIEEALEMNEEEILLKKKIIDGEPLAYG